ncbi:40S ribosomal protein S20 [Rhodotorula mucilaginosa]|uniref:40S ribosomal protein S20 n=2 Tax=Rhodotorula TaxID=5533 RepID=A0A9P6VT35_RHOMI|nr:40S ribosomal protein S20 [Rhodotorula mucilaginosa]
MHDDAEALAKIRREAFAGTVISQLISGNVDPIQGLQVGTRTLLGMLRKPNRTLRKAVVEGDESSRATPLGMSIFDLVDAAAGAPAKGAAHGAVEVESDDSSVEERPEPAPGTDLDRLHEFVAMLEGMLEQYKQYDSRFYNLTNLVVSPTAQRAGAGSALLRDFVAVADAADLPCYLESTPTAEALYRRVGFVDFGGRVSCGPGGAMVLQPMRRPAKSESANPLGLRIVPAKDADIIALAHMHNASFADDAFMRLIWGRTTCDDFDRELAKDFSRRRAHVQKGIAPGVRDPVGMTLAYRVDTAAERGRNGIAPEEEEHLPGTNVGLLKEFMAMLDRVRAAYRERDSRFYHLEILAVHPDFQRKGFGQALLESVLLAADRDNLPVYLEASAMGAGLYRKHGFVECAARASCGPDGVISTRQIQPTMSQVAKDTAKDLSSVPATKNHKIRITLTSRNVKNLEKVCGDLVNRSKDKDLRVKGPVRLPTKRLHIVTRKTPCGEGSKTWDHLEMKIHKRLIDIESPAEVVKQITSMSIESGVEVEVTIQN